MEDEEVKDGQTAEVTTEEPTEEPTEKRPIGKLLSLPPSELTNEELERVIEFKAEVKANEESLKASLKVLEDSMNESISAQEESLAKMESMFAESIAMIDAEWKEASKDDEPDEGGEDGEEL